MVASPILGTAYSSLSKNLADQRCINLFPEVVETKSGKTVGALFGCPGLTLLATIGPGPVRGIHAVEGVLYVVSGTGVYQVQSNYSSLLIGTLATTRGPVSIIDNGGAGQVAISDGVSVYVWSMGSFTTPVLPFSNPGTLVYQDTLGVVNQVGTQKLWQSNINDFTTWNGLNFNTADGSPDNIVGLADTHRQIVVVKENHTEYWVNAGNQGFVFQRLQGVYPDSGAVAPASIVRVGEVVMWLGRNDIGQSVVFIVKSYEPERVSTYALDNTIQGYGTVADAVGFGYQQGGHTFYVLNFPSAGATWVFDIGVSSQLGFPAWHQRAGFSNGAFINYDPNCACLFNGEPICGSGTSGNLYAFDLTNFTDNGAQRKWLRSWRAHSKSVIGSVPYRTLELDMETGTTAPGVSPLVVLRYSDDAHTWSSEKFGSAGASGQYDWRIRFRRLGMEKRGLVNDRIFELSSTDPFKVAILGADIS